VNLVEEMGLLWNSNALGLPPTRKVKKTYLDHQTMYLHLLSLNVEGRLGEFQARFRIVDPD